MEPTGREQQGYSGPPPMPAATPTQLPWGQHPAHPYPPYPYAPYPYLQPPPGPTRPGTVVTATVFAWLNSAVLIILGFLLLISASIVGAIISAKSQADGFGDPGGTSATNCWSTASSTASQPSCCWSAGSC